MENKNIIQYITELNQKAEKLNKQREQALGAMQAAENRFIMMAKQYEQIYGTVITKDNLEDEYSKVKAETQEKAKILAQQIEKIETGKYKSEV